MRIQKMILSSAFQIREQAGIKSGEYQDFYISMFNDAICDSRYVYKKDNDRLALNQHMSDNDIQFKITSLGKGWKHTGEDLNFTFLNQYYIQILQNDAGEKAVVLSYGSDNMNSYQTLIITLKGYHKTYQNFILVFSNLNGVTKTFSFDEYKIHNLSEIKKAMKSLNIYDVDINNFGDILIRQNKQI